MTISISATLIGLLALLVLIGLCFLLLVLVLRFGPGRGNWSQPAAEYRSLGRPLQIMLYALALVHFVAGLVLAFFVPGGGVSGLLVASFMAAFYVLMAQSNFIAESYGEVARARQARRVEVRSPE